MFYRKSGEWLTLAVGAVIALYITSFFTSASSIHDHEACARLTIEEIYRQEVRYFKEKRTHAGFEGLLANKSVSHSPSLAAGAGGLLDLERIQLKGSPLHELATDGDYFFLLRLLVPSRTSSDLVGQGAGARTPIGFACLCWPVRFGITGESSLYVNDLGFYAVSPNSFGILDGYRSFPPDFEAPAAALPKERAKKGALWFRLDDLTGDS